MEGYDIIKKVNGDYRSSGQRVTETSSFSLPGCLLTPV